MAMKVHPDVATDPDAEEKFKQVNEAYEVPERPEQEGHLRPRGRSDGPWRWRSVCQHGWFRRIPASSFYGGQGFDIGDLFGAMFGGGVATRGPKSRVRRGQDQLIRARLTLSEAVFGVTKPIKFDTHVVCATCNGLGGANNRGGHLHPVPRSR